MKALLLFFLSSLALAMPEYVPLQEVAQGRSLSGSSTLNDGLYSNPAGMGFGNVYTLDGTFTLPKSFAASILDTRTSSVGGSFGYFRSQFGDSPEFQQGLKAAVSSRVEKSLAMGVAAKAVWGPYGTSLQNGSLTYERTDYKDVDLGFLWNAGALELGVVGRNLFGGSELMGQQREISFGGRINYQNTMFLSAATHAKTSGGISLYEYGVGVEYVSPWYFSLKGGYRTLPQASKSYWGTGVSFNSPKLSLHYAVQFPKQIDEENEHLLGLTLAF